MRTKAARKKQFSLLTYSSIFTVILAVIVLCGWIFGFEFEPSLIPRTASMQAKTALGFLLVGGIGLLFNQNYTFSTSLIRLLAIPILLLAVVSQAMSFATVSCFLLISLGALIYHKKRKLNLQIAQGLWLMVIITAFTHIVSYILNISTDGKTVLFSSLNIYTMVLFLMMSLGLFLQTSSVGFAALITGPLPGSKIIRKLLPYTIFLPLLISYLLLYLTVQFSLDTPSRLWVILNTISIIMLSITFICIMAVRLNKSAQNQATLQRNLNASDAILSHFKKAIDRTLLVSELDSQGTITNVNSNFSELTGFKREEVLGKPFNSLLDLSDQLYASIMKSLNDSGFWEGEIQRKGKQGQQWVYGAIIKDTETGCTPKFLMLEQTLSSNKKNFILEDKVLMKKLQLKNKELEQFIYIVSHDLEEPLRSIRSMLELMKLELNDKLDKQMADYMDLVDASAYRMSHLLKGLIAYARLGNQKEVAITDLNKLLDQVKSNIRQIITNTNAQIEQTKLPTLEVNPVEVSLLFQHLLMNAIKFGKPDITPQISIIAMENGSFWQFTIKDNGIGMKEDHLQKIFIIFHQLNKKDEFEGIGIGLAQCKKIVSLHGGELWAESKFGEGSIFNFTLPKKLFYLT